MHTRRVRQWAVLIVVTLLTVCCGVRYLSEPPPEFDDYVQSIPAPSEATLLSEYTYRWTSPKEICTGFGIDRLYGTENTYEAVVQELEQSLGLIESDYVKVVRASDHTTYVLSDVATVGITYVTVDNRLAEEWHGHEALASGQAEYATLFAIAMEHSYGKCAPHPWWPR